MWLHQDWTLKDIYRQIYVQYAHIIDIDEENVNSEYTELAHAIDEMNDIDQLEPDLGSFKMSLQVVNPYRNKYYGPTCRVCGRKDCSNCPLPLFNKQTLAEFLEAVTH